MELFTIKRPEGQKVPIIINSPHSGTAIPKDLRANYRPQMLEQMDDTDWYLDDLYAFATEMGITLMSANISRWVIDLNRNPESVPLYQDGRLITGLCSTTNFLGEPLYLEGKEPNKQEIARRKDTYFCPYYKKLQAELDTLKKQFGKVLLYDAHSIRSVVPSIQKERFPDMILGTADGQSADESIIDCALQSLRQGDYQVEHNHPFKGGNITRHFGKPSLHQHALQLERCKDLYMDTPTETRLDPVKSAKMQAHLQQVFQALIDKLSAL